MVASSFSQAIVKEPANAARTLARYRTRLAELDAGAQPRPHERPDELRQHADRLVQAFRDTRRCELCGRKLEDADSVERGIGPECLKKQQPHVAGGVMNESESF